MTRFRYSVYIHILRERLITGTEEIDTHGQEGYDFTK